MGPMSLPAFCRRCHLSSVKAFVRKMEITFILAAQERRNRFQDSWFGKGNNALYKVRNVLSEGQCHFALLPKEQEETSVMAFDCPAMWRVVRGDALVICKHSDKARMSCIAADKLRTASHWTQWTLGLLLMYSTMCLSCRLLTTISMTKKRRSRAANSKSEFVMLPPGFFLEQRLALTNLGLS